MAYFFALLAVVLLVAASQIQDSPAKIAFAVAAAISGVLASGLLIRRRTNLQSRLNREAAEIRAKIGDGKKVKFGLFLRPFFTQRELVIPNPRHSPFVISPNFFFIPSVSILKKCSRIHCVPSCLFWPSGEK